MHRLTTDSHRSMINSISESMNEASVSQVNIKKVKTINSDQTLWQIGDRYFVISWGMTEETGVFLANPAGKITSYIEVWMDKGYQSHEIVADFVSRNYRSLMRMHGG